MQRSNQILTEKGKKKIDYICRKAARVFNSKGYLSSTLTDVSRAAGLSKGGIYHYFSAKEELLFSILDRFTDLMLEGLEENLKSLPTPEDKIYYFIRRHISQYCDNVDGARVVLHETHNLSARSWASIRVKTKKYSFIVRSIIKEFLKGKNVSSDRLRAISYTLLGMCNWIYWWYDPKGPLKPEELAEEIYNIFVGNLKAG